MQPTQQSMLISDIARLGINEETVKLIIRTKLPVFGAQLLYNGVFYPDAANLAEPLDPLTHVFFLPRRDLRPELRMQILFRRFRRGRKAVSRTFLFGAPIVENGPALWAQDDNGLRLSEQTEETLYDGLLFQKLTYRNKDGAPVVACLLRADLQKVGFYVGTPMDGYADRHVSATIPAMIEAAERTGVFGLAAVNADFFDMFGDHHPSGLCVKNGRTVANPDSRRPFVGITHDGAAVITDYPSSPQLRGEMEQAVGGLQLLLKDGRICDLSPLEPFSFTCHPRTAAGITANGELLLLEVDGRIPKHSNGASLMDLALLFLSFGAVHAVNLDGGGSSAVYVKRGQDWTLETVPADLFRPNDKLIRKDFNCIILTAPPQSGGTP